MKLPKTFVPEKDLEERTEELLEEQELKPKLDPKITAVDEILGELENNPKYYNSSTFNSNIYVAINQKGYGLVGGRYKVGNTYFIKIKESDNVDVFIRVFERNSRHYCFATTKTQKLEEFLDRFDRGKLKDNEIVDNPTLRIMYNINVYGLSWYTAFQFLSYLGVQQNSNEHIVGSVAAGILVAGLTTWLLKACLYRKNKKKMRECYKTLITDEKEAVKRALK